jgi:hypothetical protein
MSQNWQSSTFVDGCCNFWVILGQLLRRTLLACQLVVIDMFLGSLLVALPWLTTSCGNPTLFHV